MRVFFPIALLAALGGCKTVALSSDPFAPPPVLDAQAEVRQENTSVPLVYDVDWWKTLVTAPFMEFGPLETAAPAVDPETERIVVGTRDGFVRSLSPVDGKVEWEFQTPNRFWAGPKVQAGVVYVPGGDGTLYALRARTGERLWAYKTGEELVTVPVLADGMVLVASQADTLFAVNAETGKWIWQYRRDMPLGFSVRGAGAPAVADGIVYQGFADGSLVALGLKDGGTKWERKLTQSGGTQFLDVDTTPIVSQGRVYAASYKDGVTCLDAKTGDLLWVAARGGITSLVPMGRVLYATGDGHLTAIDAHDGRVLWTIDLSDKKKIDNAGGPPLLARGNLVVPTATGLIFVDPASGHPRVGWNPGKGVTATPALDGRRLYVLSNLGSVFALRLHGAQH